MKKLILLTALTVLLTGCQNYKNVINNTTETTTETILYQKDGKTAKSKTTIKVIFKEDKKETDEGFTIGSKGLGSYSFLRDISFM